MNLFVLLLRVIHVAGAVFWAGTSWALAGFFSPAANESGPAGKQVMGAVMGKRRLSDAFGAAALATVITGLLLYWRLSNGFTLAWMATGPGLSLTFGALAGWAAFFVGLLVNRPISGKIAKLGAQAAAAEGPPDPELGQEMAKLQARLDSASLWTSVLLALSLIGMAAAEQIF